MYSSEIEVFLFIEGREVLLPLTSRCRVYRDDGRCRRGKPGPEVMVGKGGRRNK